jgi:hypothetical protein
MEGADLADLYYRRWPVQENAFKEGGAVGLAEHRGNCGRIVANVAVVTELERLEARAARDGEALRELVAEGPTLEAATTERTAEQRRANAALVTRRQRLDDLIAEGKTGGKAFMRVALDHQQALVYAETTTQLATKASAALEKNRTRRDALAERSAGIAARRHRLESQRTIRQLDTTQDTILTATKLTALQLISFVLREYLPTMPMTPATFVQRVLSVRGRKETSPDHELVTFYENPRDPAVNDALRDACDRLNRRKLLRDDRRLSFAVEPPPARFD